MTSTDYIILIAFILLFGYKITVSFSKKKWRYKKGQIVDKRILYGKNSMDYIFRVFTENPSCIKTIYIDYEVYIKYETGDFFSIAVKR
jgi:hypothetical protein